MTESARERNLQAWAQATRWGRAERMTELEATMWRSERHPQQSSTIASLLILDRAPSWERLVAAHEWAISLVPKTMRRVVEPLLPTGPPAWAPDRHFALGYHLRRLQLGPSHSSTALLELAESLVLTPFDRTRPLWEATLIEGLDSGAELGGGRAAYLLKVHHSLTDGLGAVHLLAAVQSRTRKHTEDKPVGHAPQGDPSDRLGVTVDGAIDVVREVPGLVLDSVVAARHAVTDPSGVAGQALRFGASLRRVVSPPPAPPSPLFTGRTGRLWLLRTLECRLADLRAAGRTVGGSVNDAYLAALLGGLRRYHEGHGVDPDDLPVTVPVSLRPSDDPLGGNAFAGAMFAAPMGIVDPADRIAAIRGAILSQLNEPALDSFAALTPVVNRLPASIGSALRRLGGRTDLAASTVPGISERVYMAGAEVVRAYPFGPLPRVAIMAVMLAHAGTCCVGLTIDGAAVKDVDVLMDCMRSGLDEVLQLAR